MNNLENCLHFTVHTIKSQKKGITILFYSIFYSTLMSFIIYSMESVKERFGATMDEYNNLSLGKYLVTG